MRKFIRSAEADRVLKERVEKGRGNAPWKKSYRYPKFYSESPSTHFVLVRREAMEEGSARPQLVVDLLSRRKWEDLQAMLDYDNRASNKISYKAYGRQREH
ncbi:hypothetical protein MMYC01_209577 [Madurella mycetomatis]|uniref:Uncharacterized protein n=1 Tax=Madurella mycetomatis TaxID=100816 RepID=A0A175VQ44_9PEZI|nr:hypothetical protein MMYC01_209577 [Madurella mycetomatis]